MSPLGAAILAILLLALVISVYKPSYMYDSEGKAKPFGRGAGKCLCPVWLALLGGGLVVYAVIGER